MLENLRGLWDLFDYLRRLRPLVGLYLLEGRIKFPYKNQRLKAIEKWLVPFINIDTGKIWIGGFKVIEEKARNSIDFFLILLILSL